MKAAHKQGIILILIGGLFNLLHYFISQLGYVFPVILIAIPVFYALGLSFILFPGQARKDKGQTDGQGYWQGIRKTHIIAWISFFVVGITVGIYLFFRTVDLDALLQ